jgi:hypothetical protein
MLIEPECDSQRPILDQFQDRVLRLRLTR